MDAIELLISQHRALETRLQAVMDAQGEDTLRRLFAEVGDHLTLHLASEEQVFYPAVRAQRTEDILLESLEEHLSLKRVLADLLELAPSAPTFMPKFHVLKEQAEHHHREEEEHLFPTVRRHMAGDDLQRLGDEMLSLQHHMAREGVPRASVIGQTDEAAPLT